MICLTRAAQSAVREHARSSYPRECCGALLGRSDADPRDLVRAVPVANAWPDARAPRYLIPAEVVRALEREAHAYGLELLGFYHSHPDQPARPSPLDLEQAWPWYSYLIIEVWEGAAGPLRAWRLTEDRASFVAEPVRLTAPDAA